MTQRVRSVFRYVPAHPRVAWLIFLVLVVGCTTNAGGDNEVAPDPTPQQSPTAPLIATTPAPGVMTVTEALPATPTPFMRPTTTGTPVDFPWPDAVEAALVVAVDDLDVDRDAIMVASFEERLWSSTALGCPVPGRSYAQILTSGYRVVLETAGERAVYHTDASGLTIVLCERGATSER